MRSQISQFPLLRQAHAPRVLVLCLAGLSIAGGAIAEDEDVEQPVELTEEEQQVRRDEAALDEDPEAVRRSQDQAGLEAPEPRVEGKRWSADLYASLRVHAINTFDVETGKRESRIGDGNSRFGGRINWPFSEGWKLFGRAEFGFDLVDQFSTRAPLEGDGGLTTRLLYAGIETRPVTLTYGKDWSAYYRIAGMTDRFAIFGGSASGVYNAGTVGEATGTGRADDVLKARIYVDSNWDWLSLFKPFNLNLQYQQPQPIPLVEGVKYDNGIGASAMLETQSEYGLGIAYNRARVRDINNPNVQAAGIDGDSTAFALSTRAFGERWYVSVLATWLDNMEVTDQGRYFNARGYEVYAQWEVRSRWWLIGGLNALEPDDDDPAIGEYRVRYGVIGARYSFDSFRRMLYVEYRIDDSRTVDGSRLRDEVTFGIRWDFGE